MSTLSASPATVTVAVEQLVSFLENSWDLTADLQLAQGDELTGRLDRHWRRFRLAVLEALTDQEEITGQSSAAAARNSVRVAGMQERMTEMRTGMLAAVDAVRDVAAGDREVRDAVSTSAQVIRKAQEASRETAEQATAMAAAIGQIAETLTGVSQKLEELGASSQQVTSLSQVVKGITKQLNLLSLNASIEAARAGQHGRGFAVVATEVGRLGERTSKQAHEIEAVIGRVAEHLQDAGVHMGKGLQRASSLMRDAEDASRGAAEIDRLMSEATAPFGILMEQMQGHSETLAGVSQHVGSMAGQTEQLGGLLDLVQAESSVLLRLTHNAQSELVRFYKGTYVDQVKRATETMAQDLAGVFERAVDQQKVTLDDVLALEYREIKGAEIQRLSRLFDVSRVPVTGFQPPKFQTRYDAVVDVELKGLLDQYFGAFPDLMFCSLIDLNGYAPVAHAGGCKAWTGDFKRDAADNRVKRMTTDLAQVRAARMGLKAPEPEQLSIAPYVRDPKTVLARGEFLRLGNPLRQEDEPSGQFRLHTFAGLSGKVASFCAVPVYVKGWRYGVAMIGWEPRVGQA
ncbi:MAG TPA: methyl-accepting chemotaxis protein [Symbiobacteriaceae bacterium]|nr:methyl-accepting chemotaxis protein [Symbiobacteriaceae bacterium]